MSIFYMFVCPCFMCLYVHVLCVYMSMFYVFVCPCFMCLYVHVLCVCMFETIITFNVMLHHYCPCMDKKNMSSIMDTKKAPQVFLSKTTQNSTKHETQFSQEWARRKVVVKHSIKPNQPIHKTRFGTHMIFFCGASCTKQKSPTMCIWAHIKPHNVSFVRTDGRTDRRTDRRKSSI